MRRRRDLFLALPVAVFVSCGPDNPRPPDATLGDSGTDSAPDVPRFDHAYIDPWQCDGAGMALPLDEPLDGTQTRAGVITRPEELIGGEGAYGRIGHFKLYNNRVRFVVQGAADPRGPQRPVGYDLYGGNLIDADRVRPAGERPRDVFREMFPLAGFRVSSVDDIRVVCDGSNGRPAAVRVTGTDQPTRLLNSIDSIARQRFVRVITHYVLRPASDALEIHTEVDSTLDQSLNGLPMSEFLAFGSGVMFFTAETGFGDAVTGAPPLRALLGVGDPGENDRRVSYGIAPASGTMSVLFADESGAGGSYDPLSIPAGTRGESVRYFSVGTGDAASAALPLFTLRGDSVGTIAGRSTPGALVYAYPRPYATGHAPRMFARAAADGAYTMPVPPGDYDVLAVDQGHTRGMPVGVTVTAGATASADPQAGPTGTLVLDVAVLAAGGGRVRAPTRVSLTGMDVEAPDAAMGNLEGERENQGLARAIYSLTGTERVAVKPGRYRALVSHGDEHDVVSADVSVPAGGEATLRADLTRVVDTAGYVAADFHQHTIGSVDSPRALCNRVLEDVAEGLEFAATTDHDNATDFAPCTRELGLTGAFASAIGNEISVVGIGHFNAYPLATDPADPYALIGAQYWADLTPQQLFDRVRAERSDPILHISHPRSSSGKGYFAYLRLDPTNLMGSRPLATGFEALEVNESLGSPEEYLVSADRALAAESQSRPTGVPVLHDYFALIARGQHVCALGNSDTHQRNGGSGWPHNLVRVPDERPGEVTPAMVREALRAQRVLVSNGIVVRVRVNGAEPMGWQDVVHATGGAVDLEVEIQAAPWVPAREFTVYENGRPLQLTADGRGGYEGNAQPAAGAPLSTAIPAAGTPRVRALVHAHPTRDSFYNVVARGDSLEPAGHGGAFGYTNAIYVDTDGNGWQP